MLIVSLFIRSEKSFLNFFHRLVLVWNDAFIFLHDDRSWMIGSNGGRFEMRVETLDLCQITFWIL